MRCPYCTELEDRVVDSRASHEGAVIRRRRECLGCRRRFTTYERVEERQVLVLKKDGRREPFDRQKVLSGLLRACQKRSIPLERLEETVGLVEQRIEESQRDEVDARFIGEIVTEELRRIDQVAYVRFASVYREFADVSEFLKELTPLIKQRAAGEAPSP